MNKREKFLKEIAEVINRNSLEAHFNDTPDYILAKVAVEAMENFAEASARRDNWHGFKEMKGGTEYSNPRGTQHYFRCSNGRYEIGISN